MVDLEIIYLDNHLLVVNKPAGISTQPSPTSSESLEKRCKEWLKSHFAKPGNVFLHAVHRLDKPVSGLVLFARTSKALERLNEAMRHKTMQKTYLAKVEGELKPSEGQLEHYLLHGDHFAHVVSPKVKDAKRALLFYKVKESSKESSLVEIALETGRYHQIRAQLAAIGHPILGDQKYGSKIALTPGVIALCHMRFAFPHPITKEMMEFIIEAKEAF